jgi:ParB family transcriptional regulator, chromosome partitioning protein
MTSQGEGNIQLIPISLIDVVNPRDRNKRSFEEMTLSIQEVGLKKPITVSRREHPAGVRYEVVCGQGRLEAYQALGQAEIPAILDSASPEECLLKSLVENLGRRKHSAVDLLQDLARMKNYGYNDMEIARKTGLNPHYVRDVVRLIQKGEERLLKAVQAGQIPITVAIEIAESDDAGVQAALMQAYEKKILRGRKFLIVKNIIERRKQRGKKLPKQTPRSAELSPAALIRTYRQDADRKHFLIRKATATRDQLVFATEAMRTLLADQNFVTLLRAEALDTLPRNLASRMRSRGAMPS